MSMFVQLFDLGVDQSNSRTIERVRVRYRKSIDDVAAELVFRRSESGCRPVPNCEREVAARCIRRR